jgi:Ca-activated chloride channel family protein
LVDQLRPQDHVAIVTYASGVHVPLESATGAEQAAIRSALEALQSGGSTAGAGGIQRAYELARAHRVTGVNRVLLATDGDFNVGIRSLDELHAFIEQQKHDGIFLTVLGFGTGNLKDDKLETLADKGNGVYAYVDRLSEGRRVLVEQFGASMMTVAKDVKLQVEFNPRHVAGYRLVGYENRTLAAADFKDDRKDGGELGAGHAVTALYEVVPAGVALPGPAAEPLEYQETVLRQGGDDELLTLRIRYKPPQGDESREITRPVLVSAAQPSASFRLAATAAAFGMLLKGSPQTGTLGWDALAAMAEDLDKNDGSQQELAALIESARRLAKAAPAEAVQPGSAGSDR